MKQLFYLSLAFLAITGCRKIETDGEKEKSKRTSVMDKTKRKTGTKSRKLPSGSRPPE